MSGSTSALDITDQDSLLGGDALSRAATGNKNFNFGANPNLSILANSSNVGLLLFGVVAAYFLLKKGRK